jgi:hypothetical protein
VKPLLRTPAWLPSILSRHSVAQPICNPFSQLPKTYLLQAASSWLLCIIHLNVLLLLLLLLLLRLHLYTTLKR